MTTVSPMTAGSILPMVNRTYKQSHTFQWVREVVVNSLQAGATKVEFTTEWQAAQNLGVHRRMVTDNGCGIPRDRMVAFLKKFGGSGKTIGDTTENYGVGLKTSTLPWNKHGLVAISRHEGEVSMMWLQHDGGSDSEVGGNYGARMFDIEDTAGLLSEIIPLDEFDAYEVDGVDWTKVFPGEENGFALIFLGNSDTDDTIQGDPNRDENGKYDITQYLNSRFWTFPENVKISVGQYENWGDRKSWPTSKNDPKYRQSRNPVGLRETIQRHLTPTAKNPERGAVDSGTIEVPAGASTPGATIHWWLSSQPGVGRGDIVSFPIAGLVFSSHDNVMEVFDLKAKGAQDNLTTARMNRFCKVSVVRDRLAILVEPHNDQNIEIFPELSRTRLQFDSPVDGGTDLSWQWWHDAWHDNMPKAVQDAVDAYYKERTSGTGASLSDEDYTRLAQRYLASLRMKVTALFPRKDGTVPGKGRTALNTPGSRRRRKPRRMDPKKPAGDTPREGGVEDVKLRQRTTTAGLVGVGKDDLLDFPWAVSYNKDEHMVIINTASTTYKRAVDAIVLSQAARRGRLTEAQEDLVRIAVLRAMMTIVVTAVTEAESEAAARPEDAEKILSDAALSTCLMGIHHVESVASGYIGSELSGKKKVRS